jgi:biotin-(acetyl-CoA carboxylase) ligase
VVGIGINVNQNLMELPEAATSLFLCLGRQEDRNKILREYLNRFEKDYLAWRERGFNYLKENWFRLTSLKGKHVKVKTNGAHITGIVEDLGYNCKLIIRNDLGFHIEVSVEELVMIR